MPFAIVLTVVVFVHEMGHYLVARWNKVYVEVFSIGFGPEVWGWTDRQGTRWKISWFPFGGYIRMLGDAEVERSPDLDAPPVPGVDPSRSVDSKTVGQRMAISVAGPAANYLLTFVLFVGIFSFWGMPYNLPEVGQVVSGSVAEKAGFQPKDRIVQIDGQEVEKFEDFVRIVSQSPGKQLTFHVAREGKPLTLTATPEAKKMRQGWTGKREKTLGSLGVGSGGIVFQKHPFLTSVSLGCQHLGMMSWQMLKGLGEILTGQRSLEGGPVMIMRLSGDVAHAGFSSLVWFVALLSLNLAVINLLPIPMMDGGHLALYTMEAVRGRPLSDKALEWVFRVGLSLVVGIFFLATWNDLKNLKVLEWLFSLFS